MSHIDMPKLRLFISEGKTGNFVYQEKMCIEKRLHHNFSP